MEFHCGNPLAKPNAPFFERYARVSSTNISIAPSRTCAIYPSNFWHAPGSCKCRCAEAKYIAACIRSGLVHTVK